jgi:hypothetical protein
MLAKYRIPQGRLRHLNDYLRIVYSQRSDSKEQYARGQMSFYVPENSVTPGPGMRTATLPYDEKVCGVAHSAGREDVPTIREVHYTVAIPCRRCGEQYPLSDFYYTKKTGLCIPCWEEKGI